MAIIKADDFSGTAGQKIIARPGWAKIGSGWDPHGPEINGSNQCAAATDTDDTAFVGQDAGVADHYVQAAIYAGLLWSGSGNRPGLGVRSTGRGEGWFAVWRPDIPGWALYRAGSGAGFTGFYAHTHVDGDVLRLEAEGDTLRLFINGVERITESGILYGLTETGVGFNSFNSTPSAVLLDNYEAGTLEAGPPVLSAPTTTGITSNSATVGVTTTGSDGIWYSVCTTSDEEPSETQIKAGQDHLGSPAAWADDLAISSPGAKTMNATGLASSTTYHTYSVHTNGASQDSNVLAASPFMTDAAALPPVVVISSQVLDGQELTISGSYSGGAPTSATLTVPAASPPNGAVTIGPLPITYSGGTYTITVAGITPGDYDQPEVMMSNAAGSDTEYGSAFTVVEIDGEPEAPNPGDTAESVAPADTVNATAIVGINGTIQESATPADTQNRSAAQTRATNETLATADASGRTATQSRSQAEAMAFVDASTASPVMYRATPETVAPVDTQNRGMSGTGGRTDALATTEVVSGGTGIGGLVAESVAPADAQSSATNQVCDATETLGTADAQSVTLGVQGFTSENAALADSLGGLVVMGTTTDEALLALADSLNGTVSTIVGVVDEVVVLDDQQFQALIVGGGVLEFCQLEDSTDAAPIITPLTVVEQVNLVDTTNRLQYPKPPGAGSTGVRRFIVYYK